MSVLGELWDGFTGKSQEKDLQQAKAKSDADLTDGYGAGQARYDQAKTYFAPYAETGGKANAMYADATGVNGQPAYDAVAKNFMTGDPFRQSNEDFANEQLKKTFNARGSLYGGNAMLAAARGSLERGSTDWNNWLNRLQGQAGQGFQAAGSTAGLTAGQGDMSVGEGTTRAGSEITYGNAMAGNRNTLMNNLMGVGDLAVRAVGASQGIPVPPKPKK